ncbi:MAG TPA: nucleoside phosphorylase [Promineifilum sp.]
MAPTDLPITGLPLGGVAPRVITCGDPARTDRIAEQLDHPLLLSHRREYRAHAGSYRGIPVTVCSHGIGAPGAAIAFEELVTAGARAIVRVGTCGGLQPDIKAGDLLLASAAVQNTGYGRETVPAGYPAAADPGLILALQRSIQSRNLTGRTGIVLTRDSFYPGVHVSNAPDYQTMSRARVLAVEMECAALFIVGSLRAVSTAAVLVVDGNVLEAAESMSTYKPGQEIVLLATDSAITVALDALSNWP